MAVEKGGLGGSAKCSWAAPRATSRGGQCVVSLSGRSSHTHNGTACTGARSVSGVLQSVPQMWPLCLGAPGTEALCESPASLGSPRKTRHGEKAGWELKDSILLNLIHQKKRPEWVERELDGDPKDEYLLMGEACVAEVGEHRWKCSVNLFSRCNYPPLSDPA